ncbi:MAG: hypothetical protein RMK17_02685, partial [bacterium]|nr:hypothetical protein [bacterium]
VGRRCAITIKPCNKQCYFDVLPQEEAQLLLNKTEDATLKMVEVLSPYLPETDFKTVQKTLALGSSDVAPSQKVMGAALAKLNDQQKSKLYVLLRRWDKKRPLKDILKAHMPELDDDFVEHFEKIAHQLFLKSESEKSFPSKRSFKLDRAQTVLIPSELKFLYWDEEQLREHLRQGFLPARTSLSSVFLKRKTGADSKFSAIDRELAYYQLVRDFFQMPNHLVPINSIDLTSKELNLPVFANEPAQHGDWLIVQALNALPLLCCDIDLTNFFSNHLANLQKFALIDFCLGVEERLPASLLYNFDYQNFAIVDNDVAFLAPNPEKFVYCELIGDIPLEKAVCDWVQSLNLKELSKHLILLDIPQATMLDILRRLSILQQLCQESQPLLKKLLEQACQNFSQGDKND